MSNTSAKSPNIPKSKSISVILTAEANERLSQVAKNAGRSRQLEAMLRLHDHLKKFPEINGDYFEITSL